jgi:hypothetical protein
VSPSSAYSTAPTPTDLDSPPATIRAPGHGPRASARSPIACDAGALSVAGQPWTIRSCERQELSTAVEPLGCACSFGCAAALRQGALIVGEADSARLRLAGGLSTMDGRSSAVSSNSCRREPRKAATAVDEISTLSDRRAIRAMNASCIGRFAVRVRASAPASSPELIKASDVVGCAPVWVISSPRPKAAEVTPRLLHKVPDRPLTEASGSSTRRSRGHRCVREGGSISNRRLGRQRLPVFTGSADERLSPYRQTRPGEDMLAGRRTSRWSRVYCQNASSAS